MSRLAGTTAPKLRSTLTARIDDCAADLAWTFDGSALAVASVRGPITLFATGAEDGAELPGHPGGTLSISWHPREAVLASAGRDGIVRLWRPGSDTGDEVLAEAGWAARVGRSHDGAHLAAAIGTRLYVLERATGTRQSSSKHTSTIADLAWHPSRERIATAAYGGVTV
ncbi:MAG: WD40 repeat domain-containing protein [Gaiellaceae bacterium MAG52_C11]|nr:WD40 repeat domain-containing protein [Candidatus Gaiellasilicea maunaloa]